MGKHDMRAAGLAGALLLGACSSGGTGAPSRPIQDDSGQMPPTVNDHWHAVIGANICGEWLPDAAAFEESAITEGFASGIHTHGDGLVHVHPYVETETGANATLGRYLAAGSWHATENALVVWDGEKHRSGDRCDGSRAEVRWSVDGVEQAGDPRELRLEDGQVIAFALLPDGARIGTPPSAELLTGRNEPA